MDILQEELQKMYDSEIHVAIGWLWDGAIDVSIGNDAITGNVKTVAEVLPWLQAAIAEHYPESKYNVDRTKAGFSSTLTVREHQKLMAQKGDTTRDKKSIHAP
jgi:hypothetical protein